LGVRSSHCLTMSALRFNPASQQLSLVPSASPPPISQPDHVVIEVAFAGLCGTDIHIIQGEFPCSKCEFTLGHEFSGIVREVGDEVSHVVPGDRVAVDPQSYCNTCAMCTSGRYHLCPVGGVNNATGIHTDGGWAKWCRVSARQVHKLPHNITLQQGALCEPISCIMWGVERCTPSLRVGREILIMGAGIIGNLWSIVLHHLGHRSVTIVEPSPTRRGINKTLGLGFSVLSPDEFELKVKGGEVEFDLAIDCSGNGRAVEGAFSALRSGGTLCIFGVAHPSTRISLSPFEIFKKEITIVGTIINPFSFQKAVGIMEAMDPKYLDFEKLGIRKYSLKEYERALEDLKSGNISKVCFTINPQLE